MTPEEAAIRERDARWGTWDPHEDLFETLNAALADRRALLALLDAERAEADAALEGHGVCEQNMDAEIARLNAEVERLRAQDHKWAATLARGLERDRIRAAVEGLPVQSLVGMTGDASVDNYVDRAAVLAAIEGAEHD